MDKLSQGSKKKIKLNKVLVNQKPSFNSQKPKSDMCIKTISYKSTKNSPKEENTVLSQLWTEIEHLQDELRNSYSAWLCSLVVKILKTNDHFSEFDQIITLGMLLDVDELSVKQLEKHFEDTLRLTLELKHEYESEHIVHNPDDIDWKTAYSINAPILKRDPRQQPC